ncbi:MAG: prepilin peptidase [Enterococcus sp.]|nr:prepilin peptidase [Enterococcus sp.]
MPIAWLTDYDAEPSEKLVADGRNRLKNIPLIGLFSIASVFIGFQLVHLGWPSFAMRLFIIMLLFLIALCDFKYMIIPDQTILPLMTACVALGLWNSNVSAVYDIGIALLIFGLGYIIMWLKDKIKAKKESKTSTEDEKNEVCADTDADADAHKTRVGAYADPDKTFSGADANTGTGVDKTRVNANAYADMTTGLGGGDLKVLIALSFAFYPILFIGIILSSIILSLFHHLYNFISSKINGVPMKEGIPLVPYLLISVLFFILQNWE